VLKHIQAAIKGKGLEHSERTSEHHRLFPDLSIMSRVYVGGLRDTITERELEDEVG
jgi:hypothetical protein